MGPSVIAEPAGAAFPGDNGRLVFASNRVHDRELWTVNADGTDPVQLTDNQGFFQLDDEAQYSADGTRLVFVRHSGFSGFAVWSMDADGGSQTQLTANPSGYTDNVPVWSPDGSRIAFMSGRHDSQGEIYTMASDGSDLTRLTVNAGFTDTQPVYSPDGSRLAYEGQRSGDSDSDIYVMDTDGTNVVQLTGIGDSSYDGNVDWSPDGQQMVFSSNRNGPFRLFVMNADGSGQTSLGVSGVAPEWSPDGSKIVYLQTAGVGEIGVVDADGSNGYVLNMPGQEGFLVDWQPVPGDPDGDDDGVADGEDNCLTVANPDQADADGDLTGDACDEYTFTQFTAPVDDPPVVNVGRAGRVYPLKWTIVDASQVEVTDLGAVQSVRHKAVPCGTFAGDPTDSLEATAAGGSGLRYDDGYIYNWSSPSVPGCYEVYVVLADEGVHTAQFRLR